MPPCPDMGQSLASPNMKQLLLICAVVVGQSVLAADKKIADETGSYTLKTKNGKKTFSAKDKNGDELFTGPVDNEKQRDALDRNLIKKLEQLEGMGGGKGGLQFRQFQFNGGGQRKFDFDFNFRRGNPKDKPEPKKKDDKNRSEA